MSLSDKLWHTMGFSSTFLAYGFFPFLWDNAFYHLIAFAFVCLNVVIYKIVKGQWKLVALVMLVTSINNLLDELFFNPKIIDYNEYLTLIITIIIVYIQRKKWKVK